MKGSKYGPSFKQDLHILVLVVGGLILPAAEQDADPFEGQGADYGMIFFAFDRVVFNIVTSPLGLGDREASKFMEALALKLGAGLPRIDDSAFAAAFGDRSNA